MPFTPYRSKPYTPGQKSPYKISRSKIELFMQCPRCFWLDARKKITRPQGPPFNINKAIDELFKKEFDRYRASNTAHPLMIEYGVEAVPFAHADLDTWRANFTGVATEHTPTNFLVFGAIDDVWINAEGELHVVDYKATAKATEVSINSAWQISYKRQIEVYQWLLRQNGFTISPIGYFVYTNGRLDMDDFNDRIEFKTKIIAYEGSDAWIEPTLIAMKTCLESDVMPSVGEAAMGGPCDFCSYARARTELTVEAIQAQKRK